MNNRELGLQRMEDIVRFLYQFRIATSEQLSRVCSQGDKPSQSARSRILNRLKTHGIISDYHLFTATKKIWYVTNNGCTFTPVSWIGSTNGQNITRTQVCHTLAVSSIASQILNETEINPLGIPENEWALIRDGVANRTTHLVSEHEINTSYSQELNQLGAEALRAIFANTVEAGNSVRDYMIKAIHEYDPDGLFAWRLATSAYAYDPNLKTYLDAEEVLDASQLPTKRTTLPGDERLLLTDHPIDLGLCVDDDSDRPYTAAIEMELNPKSLNSYIGTLASFQSNIGLDMFDRVVWLCTDNKTINRLKKAIEIVGNINDQIVIKKIVPVQSDRLWIGTEIALKDNIDYINRRIEANKTKQKTKTTANKPASTTPTRTNSTANKPTANKLATTPNRRPTPTTTTRQQFPIKQEQKPATETPAFNYDFLDADEDSGNKPETNKPIFNMNIVNHNSSANPFNGGNR